MSFSLKSKIERDKNASIVFPQKLKLTYVEVLFIELSMTSQ